MVFLLPNHQNRGNLDCHHTNTILANLAWLFLSYNTLLLQDSQVK